MFEERLLKAGRRYSEWCRLVDNSSSTAQLDEIYKIHVAQILKSCLRSLVVPGMVKTDPRTREDMSRSLSKYKVEEKTISKS